MATIGDYDDNEEGYIDESIRWLSEERVGEIVRPGYLTVGQCALLIMASEGILPPTEPAVLENAVATYIMLIHRDISEGELTIQHPQTLLRYSEYLKMAASGLYGNDGDNMPMPDMGWLVPFNEAKRWCEEKGFKVDLSEARDGAVDALQANLPSAAESAENDTAEIASLFDPVHFNTLEKIFPTGADKWQNYSERATRNGLVAARQGRAMFNPYLAGLWWLDKQHPPGWDVARLRRVLAARLPDRSRGNEHLLTGELE